MQNGSIAGRTLKILRYECGELFASVDMIGGCVPTPHMAKLIKFGLQRVRKLGILDTLNDIKEFFGEL